MTTVRIATGAGPWDGAGMRAAARRPVDALLLVDVDEASATAVAKELAAAPLVGEHSIEHQVAGPWVRGPK